MAQTRADQDDVVVVPLRRIVALERRVAKIEEAMLIRLAGKLWGAARPKLPPPWGSKKRKGNA